MEGQVPKVACCLLVVRKVMVCVFSHHVQTVHNVIGMKFDKVFAWLVWPFYCRFYGGIHFDELRLRYQCILGVCDSLPCLVDSRRRFLFEDVAFVAPEIATENSFLYAWLETFV